MGWDQAQETQSSGTDSPREAVLSGNPNLRKPGVGRSESAAGSGAQRPEAGRKAGGHQLSFPGRPHRQRCFAGRRTVQPLPHLDEEAGGGERRRDRSQSPVAQREIAGRGVDKNFCLAEAEEAREAVKVSGEALPSCTWAKKLQVLPVLTAPPRKKVPSRKRRTWRCFKE